MKNANLQEVASNGPERPEEISGTGAVRRELRKVELGWLRPYENNPRIIENAVPLVEESIRQVGYITPIVADEDGVILAGHTRYAALKESGVKECEVVVIHGATEEQKKKYRLLDNKTGEIATWNNVLLSQELEDVDFDGFDFGQPVKAEDFPEDARDGYDPGLGHSRVVICPRCGKEVPA